jgi:hypothetical protein
VATQEPQSRKPIVCCDGTLNRSGRAGRGDQCGHDGARAVSLRQQRHLAAELLPSRVSESEAASITFSVARLASRLPENHRPTRL